MLESFLSPQQRRDYHDDGFIILPDFKSAAEIAAVKSRAENIIKAHDLLQHRTVFSTGEQREKLPENDQSYFLESAHEVRCFLEQHAFNAKGDLAQDISLSINKIGHALHDRDAIFSKFSRGDKLAQLAKDLGLRNPKIWQSMYIFKQPKIGGQVDWHQDASFFQTKPSSVTTFWFALDDAVLDNGCLWVERAGHNSPLRQVFVRKDDQAKLITIDDTPWPDLQRAEPVEVKAGTLVCFHGHLPHYSAQNKSNHPRHAYTLHVTDGSARYSLDNWIQDNKAHPATGF